MNPFLKGAIISSVIGLLLTTIVLWVIYSAHQGTWSGDNFGCMHGTLHWQNFNNMKAPDGSTGVTEAWCK